VWRPVLATVAALLLLWLFAGAWGSAGPIASATFDIPSIEPKASLPQGHGLHEAAPYIPPWRLVLHRLFRRGLRRGLTWGLRKLRSSGRIRGALGGITYFATVLLSGLVGPCGRLWRYLGG